MKIALFGATGHIGQSILDEALSRGHEVIAIVRDPTRMAPRHAHVPTVSGDAAQPESWLDAVRGVDVAVASLSSRRDGAHETIPANAATLLDHLPRAGVKRFVWVGDAASLETSPGVRVLDDPDFPDDWKPEATSQAQVLELFRQAKTDVEWTYVSPAKQIEPGERTCRYRFGGDQLLVDANGQNRISIPDYAYALLDRVHKNDARKHRIGVAY